MRIKFQILLVIFLFLFPGFIRAQDKAFFIQAEDSLRALTEVLWKGRSDSVLLAVNEHFKAYFRDVLSKPGSFEYPFDSLTGISRLRSDDNRLRIISWDIPLSDGTYKYSGFIQAGDRAPVPLIMRRSLSWQNEITDADHWYGALYYQIISISWKKKTMYTLIGWDGNNRNSDRKFIDVLTLDSDDIPEFGGAYFKTKEGIRNRVIVDYAEKANVILRYDQQSYWVKKGNRIREKKASMIITDRLIKLPAGAGVGSVPTGDTYDAYFFLDGYWTFVEDVNVRNPR